VYTIGQCAQICAVSTKTLRHYDAIGLFSPAHIGPGNQYRYYSREQIPLLRRIVFLRELGLGLEVIRQLLQSGALADPARLGAILEEHARGIRSEIERQRALLASVERAAGLVLGEVALPRAPGRHVVVKTLPPIDVVGLRRQIHLSQLAALVQEAARKLHGPPEGKRIHVYHNPEFDPHYVDVEVLFPVAGPGDQVLPATTVASVLHVGATETIGASYEAVYDWIEDQGRTDGGPPREVVLLGPDKHKSRDDLVLEIQVPIA
jgi:DNA-binding transcriptional MerR regulator